VRPALHRLLLGFAAALVLVGIPADAQIRPDSKDPRYFRWSTRRVTIHVKPSDFIDGHGTATITIPRAIIGYVRPRAPWQMYVSADAFFTLKRYGVSEKPCSNLAIRWTEDPGDYHVLSPYRQLVASGPDNRGRREVAFDLTFAAYLTDIAGEYSIELYFNYENN